MYSMTCLFVEAVPEGAVVELLDLKVNDEFTALTSIRASDEEMERRAQEDAGRDPDA
jgi:hypothetical protein